MFEFAPDEQQETSASVYTNQQTQGTPDYSLTEPPPSAGGRSTNGGVDYTAAAMDSSQETRYPGIAINNGVTPRALADPGPAWLWSMQWMT
jgi:hypothetical protein